MTIEDQLLPAARAPLSHQETVVSDLSLEVEPPSLEHVVEVPVADATEDPPASKTAMLRNPLSSMTPWLTTRYDRRGCSSDILSAKLSKKSDLSASSA